MPRTPTPATGPQQLRAAEPHRELAAAHRRIAKLAATLTLQQDRIRELEAQLRKLAIQAVDVQESEATVADLVSEIRELTRANREHSRRNDSLRGEIAKLKAGEQERLLNRLRSGEADRRPARGLRDRAAQGA